MSIKILKTVQKVPGGMMVVPLFFGMLVNTFFPQLLTIGGLTTGLLKTGTNGFMAMCLLCVGSTIDLKKAGEPLKRGAVLLLFKFLAGFIPALLMHQVFHIPAILSITPIMLLAAVTNSNGGIYMGLVSVYGDSDDMGAYSLLALNDGPFFTLIGWGVAGLGDWDIISIIASVFPIFLGFLLGNLDSDMRKFLAPGVAFSIPFFAFGLGTGLSLGDIVTGGLTGILLGVLTVIITAIFTVFADRVILKRPGYAAMALTTTAGNAVATPAILAEFDQTVASSLAVTTSAVATSVIVTAILAPIVTSFWAKRFGCAKFKGSKSKSISATD